MDDFLIMLDNLSIGYEGHPPVLSGVTIHIERGSFTGLLGTNGSGKSTLIKTMLGIIPPLSGRMRFGSDSGREPVLGYVPQREALDPIFLLSSLEVVLMGACGRVGPGRLLNKAEHHWAEHCLEVTGVSNLGRRRFSQLSGGQKQRVLIARALAAKPDFLFLDEPTAGIDAAASQAIMDLLTRLHEEQKLAILMVNHDLAAVRRAVRQVIWLHQGKVLHGPVDSLLSREKIEEIMELELH
jgi:ABC-type Mn2+/Zn2+ transport system ATPase subunit